MRFLLYVKQGFEYREIEGTKCIITDHKKQSAYFVMRKIFPL